VKQDKDVGNTRLEAHAYAAPAIARVEGVAGLLGRTKGSYCPPTAPKKQKHRRR
jgi:hypothetical protein